jgi:hypothetical protein
MLPTLLTPLRYGLIPLVSVLVVAVAVECVLYILKTPFYYRMGPTLFREQWQTSATAEAVWAALRAALPTCTLSVRDGGSILCFRRRWWVFSAYPRATLSVSDGSDAATIVYEVKPFISMAPFAIAMMFMALAGVAAFVAIGTAIFIVLVYALWRYELRKLARLDCLRKNLRGIGVMVCTQCGYDLFQREAHQPCPECGVAPAGGLRTATPG